MNKQCIYTAAINYVNLFQKLLGAFTDEPRFAVLHNTWRIGGAPFGHYLVGLGSVNCKPVNRNFSEFLSKGRPRLCLSAHDPPKTQNCTNQRNHNQNREDFSFSRRWPWAYFLNGPNAAASTVDASGSDTREPWRLNLTWKVPPAVIKL